MKLRQFYRVRWDSVDRRVSSEEVNTRFGERRETLKGKGLRIIRSKKNNYSFILEKEYIWKFCDIKLQDIILWGILPPIPHNHPRNVPIGAIDYGHFLNISNPSYPLNIDTTSLHRIVWSVQFHFTHKYNTLCQNIFKWVIQCFQQIDIVAVGLFKDNTFVYK